MEGYIGNKPDVGWWLGQIRQALEYRKRAAYEVKWPRWRNYYRGLWRADVLPSNLFFKMVRTIVPRIYFRDPSVSITSLRMGMEYHLMAQLLERLDNQMLRKMGLKKQIKRIVQDNFMFGTGIGKLGFGSQFQSTPETLGSTQAPLVKGREALEYNINIQPNMPWFLRASPGSYLIESGAADKDSARWDAYIIHRPLADIQNDPRLKNNKDLGPSHFAQELRGQDYSVKYPVDQAEMYEIRDRKTGKVFIISPAMRDKTMLFEDDEFFKLGIDPTNAVIFNEDDEHFWGVPDAQILEPQQLELNEIKTMRMLHRRLSVLKILVKRGSMTQEEIDKLLSPDPGAVAFMDGNLATDLKILSGESIPSDLTEAEMNIMNDVRETLGFSRNEFGEFKPGSKSPTATETNAVKVASEIRVDERRDQLADMLTKVVNDIHPIIFNHWSREQVMDIVGPGGIRLWVAFTPTMLRRGSYEVNIDPDTSVPKTKQVRTQEAVGFYQLLKDNPFVDPMQLTRYVLREMHGVNFDDMMRPLQGAGMTPINPMTMNQLVPFMQDIMTRYPQLAAPQGGPPGQPQAPATTGGEEE